MRLLGMSGRGDDEDAALEEEVFPKDGSVLVCAQEGLGDSAQGIGNNGDIAAGGSANAGPESTPAGVDGAQGTARREGRHSEGVARYLTGVGPSGTGSDHAAEATGSVANGAGRGATILEQRLPAPATIAADLSQPGESARVGQQLPVVDARPADCEDATRGGNESTDSPTLSPAKAWPKVAPGSPASPGSASNGHQQQWRHPDSVRQATTNATMPHGSEGGRPAAGGGGVLSTSCVGYDRGDSDGCYEGGFEVGSPDPAEQSLDTVSLSEATEHPHQQYGRKDASGRRSWIMSSLWGGGGGAGSRRYHSSGSGSASSVGEQG